MELLIWLFVFIVSLYALVKAADWFALGIQGLPGKSGLSGSGAGMAVVSVCVVLPELAAAIAAVAQGKPELAAAIAIGSAIANILLVVGVSAAASKSITFKKDHIENDLPLFAASVAFFYFIAGDGQIAILEGALALAAILVYFIYVFSSRRRSVFTPRDLINPDMIGAAAAKLVEMVPSRMEKYSENAKDGVVRSPWKAVYLLAGGAALLAIAANFTIQSVAAVSDGVLIPGAVIAMTVLSIGAAMPEVFSGLAAARKKQYEKMMGNVFSSVAVSLLLVTGAAALFTPLPLEGEVLSVGLPFLAVSAGLLAVSGLAGRVNLNQGLIYLFFYFLFAAKLFGIL